jgi:hypothetical protein
MENVIHFARRSSAWWHSNFKSFVKEFPKKFNPTSYVYATSIVEYFCIFTSPLSHSLHIRGNAIFKQQKRRMLDIFSWPPVIYCFPCAFFRPSSMQRASRPSRGGMEFINAILSLTLRVAFCFSINGSFSSLKILSLRSLQLKPRLSIRILSNVWWTMQYTCLFTDDSLRQLVLIRLILFHLEFFSDFFFPFWLHRRMFYSIYTTSRLHNRASFICIRRAEVS